METDIKINGSSIRTNNNPDFFSATIKVKFLDQELDLPVNTFNYYYPRFYLLEIEFRERFNGLGLEYFECLEEYCLFNLSPDLRKVIVGAIKNFRNVGAKSTFKVPDSNIPLKQRVIGPGGRVPNNNINAERKQWTRPFSEREYELLGKWAGCEKYPYFCTEKASGREFTPVSIDYDNQQVVWQKGQSSDAAYIFGFDEVIFKKNPYFVDLTEEFKD